MCKTVEAPASDDKALQTALDCKKNRGLKEKIGEIFKKIADFVKSYFKGDKEKGLLPHNAYAQAFLDSAESLQEMAEIVSRGFDAARENEAKYGSRESGVRFSVVEGEEKASIKEQLHMAKPTLEKMEPVVELKRTSDSFISKRDLN